MPFQLTKADEDAISNVDIVIDGDGGSIDSVSLNDDTLMFPPTILKDSKTAKWLEVQSGGYEPFKYYVQSQSRQLGLQFEWVTGGFRGTKFGPAELHLLISSIKSYFYGVYFGGSKDTYPRVLIRELYGVIPRTGTGGDNSQGGATFRMMSVDVKYSRELTKVDDVWYPLHVQLTMSLESVSALKPRPDSAPEETPFSDFKNLMDRPNVEWF